jgi:hypothetical protein
MRAELEQLKRKRAPKPNKKQNKSKNPKGKGQRSTSDVPKKKYCYGHGYQQSHTSAECKLLNGDKKRFNHAMRNSQGPNDPPGGSTKVNSQVVTAPTRTVSANMAYNVGHEDRYEAQHDQDLCDDNEDETTAFLAQILNDEVSAENEQGPDSTSGYLSPDYITTRASAMMMADELILIDQLTEEEDKREAQELNANVSIDDSNNHTRVCALEASFLAHPTQAVTAAPVARTVTAGSCPHDRSGFGQTSRKGPDLGGSKVMGATDSVIRTGTTPNDRFPSACYSRIKITPP